MLKMHPNESLHFSLEETAKSLDHKILITLSLEKTKCTYSIILGKDKTLKLCS